VAIGLDIKIKRKGVDSPENSGRQQGKTLVFPDGELA